MKSFAIAATLLMVVAGVGAQEYPHAFPRAGTTRLFDNERVTAWEVHWLKDVPQPVHRHRFDMAGVYLRYGPIRVTQPDGTVAQPPPGQQAGGVFAVPRPYYQPKDITHREEAIGFPADAPERLAIMFDVKPYSVPALPTGGLPTAFPRERAIKAIDNERVIEWDYTWEVGKPVATHIHDRDSVQVFFEGGTIRFTDKGGRVETKTFAFKDARFIPRGTVDMEEATAGSPRAVTIELK